MNIRLFAWVGVGGVLTMMIIEALLLLPKPPARETVPEEIRETVRALEERAAELERAYARLEEAFGRYIRRAPGPTPGLAVETLFKDLDRLRDEVAALQTIIGAHPERAAANASMRSEIRRVGERVEALARDRDHWNAVFWQRTRWLIYLAIGKGILILGILGSLVRNSPAAAGRVA